MALYQIGQFQAERNEWERERENLDNHVACLKEEVKRLRAERAQTSGGDQDDSLILAAHEKLLAFSTMLESVRADLEKEQMRSRALEQRALDAERRLREEGPRETRQELADEVASLREQLEAERHRVLELKEAAIKRKEAWKDELSKVSQQIEQSDRLEEEVHSLRLERNGLQEELREVIDREKFARREAAQALRALKELENASRGSRGCSNSKDMDSTSRGSRGSNDGGSNNSIASLLKNPLAGAVADDEEMRQLTKVVGGQLVAVEQELQRQVQRTADLTRLVQYFLQHAQKPLASTSRTCEHIAVSGEAGSGLVHSKAPDPREVDGKDLKVGLVRVMDLIRYVAEVLEAYENRQNSMAKKDALGHNREWLESKQGSDRRSLWDSERAD